MKIQEMSTKAGPISDYFGYIILVFGYYLVSDIYPTLQPPLSGALDLALTWGLRLLIGPI